SLVGRLVRQHRLARHVTDGIDALIGRPALGVDTDKAFVIHLDFGVFQAEPPTVRPTAHGNEHASKDRLALAYVLAFEGDPNTLGAVGRLGNFGLEVNL